MNALNGLLMFTNLHIGRYYEDFKQYINTTNFEESFSEKVDHILMTKYGIECIADTFWYEVIDTNKASLFMLKHLTCIKERSDIFPTELGDDYEICRN